MSGLSVVLNSQEQAHQLLNSTIWPFIKTKTGAGVQLVAEIKEREDDRTLQQNRFYWGPCLRDISAQAVVAGMRYEPEAWHELFKRKFLGFEITKTSVAGRKRPVVIRRLRSTSKLKVRAMSKYLDQVQAFAATELGVQFTVAKWQDFGPHNVDPETGEITG
jgi:hypothetical protein